MFCRECSSLVSKYGWYRCKFCNVILCLCVYGELKEILVCRAKSQVLVNLLYVGVLWLVNEVGVSMCVFVSCVGSIIPGKCIFVKVFV